MLLMAPRRNPNPGSLADMQSLLINPDSDHCSDMNLSSATDSLATCSAASSPTSMRDVAFLKMLTDMENLFPHQQQQQTTMNDQLSIITNNNHQMSSNSFPDTKSFVQLQCCIPNETCLNVNSRDFGLINMDDLSDCMHVLCTNELCQQGQYMHKDCFDLWERMIVQRLSVYGPMWKKLFNEQSIWTQENYPTIYRFCQCKCGGYLRKDLDWCPPTSPLLLGQDEVDNNNNNAAMKNHNVIGSGSAGKKNKNKSARKNQKPILSISTLNQSNGYHQNFPSLGGGNQQQQQQQQIMPNGTSSPLKDLNGFGQCWMMKSPGKEDDLLDSRSGSVLSSDMSLSPIHNSSTASSTVSSFNCNAASAGKSAVKHQQANKSKTELYSERIRAGSGCNGIFSRRIDFSSFNVMPSTRLNSYQVKIEDEGNHGNDETRLFILSSLASQQKSRVACVLCEEPMLVFDRYPLVDGTFFLSPKKHAQGCIEVKYEGRVQYLTSVCLNCLHGVSADHLIRCRFCNQKWDGSNLVLGTMYSYDIFAAMPCCSERLKCNTCYKLLLHPMERLNFYSDYSHMVSCPYCTVQDTHFVKPIGFCYSRQSQQNFTQVP